MICESYVYSKQVVLYRRYEGKRLPNVLNTMVVPSFAKCAELCYDTDGCLAMNAVQNNGVICELTTGLSNKNEMDENATSLLLVRGMFLHEHFHFSKRTD